PLGGHVSLAHLLPRRPGPGRPALGSGRHLRGREVTGYGSTGLAISWGGTTGGFTGLPWPVPGGSAGLPVPSRGTDWMLATSVPPGSTTSPQDAAGSRARRPAMNFRASVAFSRVIGPGVPRSRPSRRTVAT